MGQVVEPDSMLKRTLKSLCCSNGWSYGVFWRFDQQNSMLLTLEDAYYEEQMGVVIDNMLLQVHMLGQGLVGQAAFTGKDRWISSDAHRRDWNSLNSTQNQNILQDDFELHHQFVSGIKTIAVVAVEPQGVVQFGSTRKILEKPEILDQTKRLLCQVKHIDGLDLSQNAPSSLNGETVYQTSSGNSNYVNLKPGHDDNCKEPIGNTLMNFRQSSTLTTGLVDASLDNLINSSFHHLAATEAQVIFSKPHTQSLPALLRSNPCINNNTANTSCWSSESSLLTSFEQQLAYGMRFQDSSNVLSAKPNTLVSCGNMVQNFQEDAMMTSLTGSINLYNSGKLIDDRPSTPSVCATKAGLPEASTSLCTFQEELKSIDYSTALSKPFLVDDVLDLVAFSPDQSKNGQPATLNDDLLQAVGVTSVSSGLDGGDVFNDIPVSHPANSVQCSITNTYNLGEKEKSLNVSSAENDLFDSLALEFGPCLTGESWEDILVPAVTGGHSSHSPGISECILELDVGSVAVPRKGLFSELGLEQLLENAVCHANPATKSGSEDQLSTAKRSKMESSSMNSAQLSGLSCIGGSMNAKQPEYNLDKKTNPGPQEEVPRSQVGLWIDDTYSINAGSTVTSQTKRPEEAAKTRKRARPGESTRPRPKDRQLIQDRVKELREIIPNSAKLTIDSLYDRTVKHISFLQSVIKYADKLKQDDEPKLIGEENGVVLRENFGAHGSGGATWAYEVGGQTMVCPILVEDLNPPGQMRIEMLCEEGGFFLEIADIIRGFGLTILKGVMEVQDNKIWARFTVEAKEHITRMDIFMSLLNLLQQTTTNGIHSTSEPSHIVDGAIPLFNNYQQPSEHLPIHLPDTCR